MASRRIEQDFRLYSFFGKDAQSGDSWSNKQIAFCVLHAMNSPFTSLVIFACVILTGLLFAVPKAQAQTPAPPQPVAAAVAANAPQGQAAAAVAANALTSNPNTVKFPNGVEMEVLRAADGPKPAPNAVVEVQYIGHLEDGTEFIRSYARRSPSIYPLSDVIGCWQTGIPEMNVGSKAKFTCPPGSANGRRPVDFIWGHTTLYFVIELIAIIR